MHAIHWCFAAPIVDVVVISPVFCVMDQSAHDNILRHFARCPLCDTAYEGVRVSLVAQESERTSFHITCPSCKTNMLLHVSRGRVGVMSVGMVTDVGKDDLALLRGEKISPNAVLDLYTDLRRYTGSLEALLRAPARAASVNHHNKK